MNAARLEPMTGRMPDFATHHVSDEQKMEQLQSPLGAVQVTGAKQFAPLSEVADVFVVIVNYNTAHLLHRCLSCLRSASERLKVSVVIVDNASRDGSVALLRHSFADCEVIENPVNIGFGRANNQVLPLCNAPFVLLLNPDAYVAKGALHACLQHMDREQRCGVLGLRLVDEAGNGNSSARDFPNVFRSFAINTGLLKHRPDDRARAGGADFVDCDWVTGCFYLIRRTTIEEVGLFDQRYFLYFEEVDHCQAAARRGWKVHCLLTCTVIHEGGASARSDGNLTTRGRQLMTRQVESELLYHRKHSGMGGFLLFLILALLTQALLLAKEFLRGQSRLEWPNHWNYLKALCRLTLQTRGGQKST